jgi:acyl-ACP thioesterase
VHADELTELVAPPQRGRIFRQAVRPGFADCAPSGRVRLDSLARWLQDIAYADVEDAGLARAAMWVVRRTRIRVRGFPCFGERFTLATFCSGLGRMWAERRTTIACDGHPGSLVEAVSLWVHLDPANWRPRPFADTEMALYGASAAGRTVSARLRHPAAPAVGEGRGWTFRACECDIAGHVNNAAYWQPLEEELLSGHEPGRIDAEIEFRAPAGPGEKLVLRDAGRRWIVNREGETHASLLIAEATGSGAVLSE